MPAKADIHDMLQEPMHTLRNYNGRHWWSTAQGLPWMPAFADMTLRTNRAAPYENFSRFQSAGKIFTHATEQPTAATPPNTTVGMTPINRAAKPDSNSPR